MPKAKLSSIGRRTRHTNQQSTIRASQNETTRLRNTEAKASESENIHALRNEVDRLRTKQARAAVNRSEEVAGENNLDCRVRRQSNLANALNRLSFRYDHTVDYAADTSVINDHCLPSLKSIKVSK